MFKDSKNRKINQSAFIFHASKSKGKVLKQKEYFDLKQHLKIAGELSNKEQGR
jgi:hypothetical protein